MKTWTMLVALLGCADAMSAPRLRTITMPQDAFQPDTAHFRLVYGPGPLFDRSSGALTAGRPNQLLIAYDSVVLATGEQPQLLIVGGYRSTQSDFVKLVLVGEQGARLAPSGAYMSGRAAAVIDERGKTGFFTDTVTVQPGAYTGYHLQVELKGSAHQHDARFFVAEIVTTP